MEKLNPIFLVILLGVANWIATALGGAVVFASSKKLLNFGYSNILAISAGIMLSASFWSLLLPSVEIAVTNQQIPGFVACSGFFFGIMFLYTVSAFSHVLFYSPTKNSTQSNLLITAISIHNIPEGLIVGVLCSGLTNVDQNIDLFSVVAISLSIGLQNIPEGLAIALPLRTAGNSTLRSFFIAVLTGFIEPVSAILGYYFVSNNPKLLPYTLAFAGGAMIYVIINEMVPEFTKTKTKTSIIWFTFGFIIMMGLDTILSGF